MNARATRNFRVWLEMFTASGMSWSQQKARNAIAGEKKATEEKRNSQTKSALILVLGQVLAAVKSASTLSGRKRKQ